MSLPSADPGGSEAGGAPTGTSSGSAAPPAPVPGPPVAAAGSAAATAAVARRGSHPLLRYAAARLATAAFLLVCVTLVTFVLANIVPGDPAAAALGERAAADPEIVAAYRAANGLDQPLPQQYVTYLGRLLHGDFGTSIQTRNPVRSELAAAFPATVELALAAIVVSVLVAVVLGMWAAIRRGRPVDAVIRTFSLIGLSVPIFWLAMVAYFFLFYTFRLLPGSGRLAPTLAAPPHRTGLYSVDALLAGDTVAFGNAMTHLVLPAGVLGLYTIGVLTRFIRSSVLEVLAQEYVLAARAKGLPRRRILVAYVLRAASMPIVTVVGLAFGSLLSGTVLVEKIFGWHGLGQYAYDAATHLDLPAVLGVGIVIGAVYLLINLVVDLLYGVLDPRVRVGG